MVGQTANSLFEVKQQVFCHENMNRAPISAIKNARHRLEKVVYAFFWAVIEEIGALLMFSKGKNLLPDFKQAIWSLIDRPWPLWNSLRPSHLVQGYWPLRRLATMCSSTL